MATFGIFNKAIRRVLFCDVVDPLKVRINHRILIIAVAICAYYRIIHLQPGSFGPGQIAAAISALLPIRQIAA